MQEGKSLFRSSILDPQFLFHEDQSRTAVGRTGLIVSRIGLGGDVVRADRNAEQRVP